MKDYANLSREELLALTLEQLNSMTLDELKAVALNFPKFMSAEQLRETFHDRHSA